MPLNPLSVLGMTLNYNTHTHTHTYIYICVCVCVCKQDLAINNPRRLIIKPNDPTFSGKYGPSAVFCLWFFQ